MTSFGWLTKLVGLVTLVPFALTSCNQPPTSSDSQTPTTPVVTTAPTDNTPSANTTNPVPTLNVEDAAEKVENALDNDPNLRAFDLDANDEGNAIILTGRVQNVAQKQLAQTLAQQLAPGISIVNRIAL